MTEAAPSTGETRTGANQCDSETPVLDVACKVFQKSNRMGVSSVSRSIDGKMTVEMVIAEPGNPSADQMDTLS